MTPEIRQALLEAGLRRMADAIRAHGLPPLGGSPLAPVSFHPAGPGAPGLPDGPLRRIVALQDAGHVLLDARCTFFLADADAALALAHAPPHQHAWRRPGATGPLAPAFHGDPGGLLAALEDIGLPDGFPLDAAAGSAHARIQVSAIHALLPKDAAAALRAIATRPPGTPDPGPLRWRRLPGIRLLWAARRDVPDAALAVPFRPSLRKDAR